MTAIPPPPPQRSAPSSLAILSGGVIGVGGAYLGAFVPSLGAAPAWGMVLGLAMLVAGTLGLGASRSGEPGRWASRGLAVCLVVGFGAGLLVPATAPRWLGIPLGTVLMGALVGLIPLIVLPLLYARGFPPTERGLSRTGRETP